MDVIQAHKMLRLTPITATEPSNHRNIMMHLPTRYDPPTFNKIRSKPQNTIGP